MTSAHRVYRWVGLGALALESLALLVLVTGAVFLRWQIAYATAPLLLLAAVSVGVLLQVELDRLLGHRSPRSTAALPLIAAVAAALLAGAAALQLTFLLAECATGVDSASGEQTDALHVSVLCNDEFAVGVGVAIVAWVVLVCEAVRVLVHLRETRSRERRGRA